MNASSLFATTLLAVIAAVGTAHADHRLYRQLDELNNHALAHARDARWEIADHFGDSRDYSELRDDARALTKALRNIEDAIFFERSPAAIRALVDDAHDVLLHFEEHVAHSDFGRVSWHGRTRIRPVGYAHMVELQTTLRSLHDDLDEMIALLRPVRGHYRDLEVIPDSPYRIEPGAPARAPARPGALVPDLSAATEIVIPTVRTRSGDATLRLLLR